MYDKKTQLWDKKSKTFPRYSEQLNAIQKGVFDKLARLGVEFAGKSLIDIGCGTGVWTLHLAQRAKSVSALDASQGMLEVLQEDTERLNLGNITFINSNFENFYNGGEFGDERGGFENTNDERGGENGGEFGLGGVLRGEFKNGGTQGSENSNGVKFDIAFASMSPALNKDTDYQAFMALAPLRVYVGWEEYRQSDLLAPIFKAFGAKQKCFDDNDMENFLRKNGIAFEKEVFEEVRHSEKTREIAIENALWHLNMAGFEPSADEVGAFIKGDTIKEVVKSKIKLLVF